MSVTKQRQLPAATKSHLKTDWITSWPYAAGNKSLFPPSLTSCPPPPPPPFFFNHPTKLQQPQQEAIFLFFIIYIKASSQMMQTFAALFSVPLYKDTAVSIQDWPWMAARCQKIHLALLSWDAEIIQNKQHSRVYNHTTKMNEHSSLAGYQSSYPIIWRANSLQ